MSSRSDRCLGNQSQSQINRRVFLRKVSTYTIGGALTSRHFPQARALEQIRESAFCSAPQTLSDVANQNRATIPASTFCSAPPTAFDAVMGYRWLHGPIRIIRVINSELVFDGALSGNNFGYNCSYDFSFKKPSPRTFRFVVPGDSFTAGVYLPMPWPERFRQLLRSRSDRSRDVEVYPFPIDGGGLLNWHSVFMNQILPDFEFDTLIIASWYENLARNFIISDSDQSGRYVQRFKYDERPRSPDAFKKIRSAMEKIYEIASGHQIDQMVDRIREGVTHQHVTADQCCKEWTTESELAPPGYAFSPDVFIKRYSAERWTLFAEIVRACLERHIPVVFCAVPTREGLLRIRETGGSLLHRTESKGLCRQFALHYFDGYGIFDGIGAETIVDLYWNKYDAHWGLPASDLFALKLSEWVTDNRLIPV